jgi:hypothetical protein
MLTEVLTKSDSEEKIEYYVEYANSVHPDFSVVIFSCNYALARSYYVVSTKMLTQEKYPAATSNLNFC